MKAADVKKDTEQGYVVLVHGLVGDVTDSFRYHATSPHRWIETHIYGANIGGSDVTDSFRTSRNLSSL